MTLTAHERKIKIRSESRIDSGEKMFEFLFAGKALWHVAKGEDIAANLEELGADVGGRPAAGRWPVKYSWSIGGSLLKAIGQIRPSPLNPWNPNCLVFTLQ